MEEVAKEFVYFSLEKDWARIKGEAESSDKVVISFLAILLEKRS